MGFNYAREKRKFDEEWEQLQREYADAGMDEEAIAQMKEFDWRWFCSRRSYDNHNQPLPEEKDLQENRNTVLFRKFPNLSVDFDIQKLSEKYAWMQELWDEIMYQRLSGLSKKDLDLITLIAIEGYTKAEVAKIWGCSRSAITQRMNKIKKILGNA